MHQSPLHLAGVAAFATGELVSSGPYKLLTNGDTGYVLYVPVRGLAAARGPATAMLLSAAMDAGLAYGTVVGAASDTYAISVIDVTAAGARGAAPGAGAVFAAGGAAAPAGAVVAPATITYVFLNRTWDLVVAPTPAFLSGAIDAGQRTVLAAGIPLVIVACARARACAA